MNQPDPPLPIAAVNDLENQIKGQFSELSTAWNQTATDWRDAKRLQFESQHLASIGPALSRLTTGLNSFMEIARSAERELQDPE